MADLTLDHLSWFRGIAGESWVGDPEDFNRGTAISDAVPDDTTNGAQQVTEIGLDTGGRVTLWYNRPTIDDSGFDKNGYNREWIHKAGYGNAGFDPWGFDEQGLDSEGFSRSGFNLKGVDRFGNRATGRWVHKNFCLDEEDYLRKNDAIDKSRTSIGQVDTAKSGDHINKSGPHPDEPGNAFRGEHHSELVINDGGGHGRSVVDIEQINGERGGNGFEGENIETRDSDIGNGEGMIDEQSGVEVNKASWVQNCQGCDAQAPLYLECGNRFCSRCITKWFETALQDASRFPVKCCQRRLRVTDYRFLPGGLVDKYQVREAEFDCPNPIYCSTPSCSALIPAIRLAEDNYAYCIICAQRTCACCKLGRPDHFPNGDCPGTMDQNKLLKLDMASEWKLCKSCNLLIEKSGGCNHITCHCKAQFCYLCEAVWKTYDCDHGVEIQGNGAPVDNWDDWNPEGDWNPEVPDWDEGYVVDPEDPESLWTLQQLRERRALIELRAQEAQRWGVARFAQPNCEHDFHSTEVAFGGFICDVCHWTADAHIYRCHHCHLQTCRRCRRADALGRDENHPHTARSVTLSVPSLLPWGPAMLAGGILAIAMLGWGSPFR